MRMPFLYSIALFIILALALCGGYFRAHDERARLTATLSAAGVSYGEASSTEELRLLWYVHAHGIDPIFSLNGTDPDALRQSLTVLRTHEDEILAHYQPDDRGALEAALYPWAYLDLLPETESARLTALSSPSYANAAAYEMRLQHLADAYVSGTRALASALRESSSTNATFAFPGQSTTEAHVVDSLRSLQDNIRIARAKAAARFHCLQFFGPSCENLKMLLTARAAAIEVPDALPAPTQADRDRDALITRINEMMLPAYVPRELPPLIAMKTDCYPYAHVYVRTWWQHMPEGGDARKSSITNDIYLDVVFPSQNPVYAKAYADGARLKYQVTGHYYLCANAGIDAAREQGALSVYALLSESPIFTSGDMGSLETRIRDGSYIDTHDVALYAHDAAARIAEVGYANMANELGTEKLSRLERIVDLWVNGSEHFDEVIREVANENDFLIYFQQRMPVFSVYMSRTFPSVIFQDGNRSFTRLPVSFASIFHIYPLAKFRMVSYNDLLYAGSTTADVLDAIFTSLEAERPYLLH